MRSRRDPRNGLARVLRRGSSIRVWGVDWGAGHYETIAQQLLPAAAVVVDVAAVRPGERATAIARASGNGHHPPPFAWHDPAAVAELFAAHGYSVECRDHDLAFTAASSPAATSSSPPRGPDQQPCRPN